MRVAGGDVGRVGDDEIEAGAFRQRLIPAPRQELNPGAQKFGIAPGYRLRYAQFLKNDFPRLPLTGEPALFRRLAGLGRRLADLQLMRAFPPEISRYPVAGSNRVEGVSFVSDAQRLAGLNPPGTAPGLADLGRVYLNREQYFEGVPSAVWQSAIGGYQVCQKWLKDRKGRLLSFDDIRHYHRTVAALSATQEIQAELDAALVYWPPA